jgi:hypothetical protein
MANRLQTVNSFLIMALVMPWLAWLAILAGGWLGSTDAGNESSV